MKIMSVARNNAKMEKFTEIIDYVMGIFREQEINSPIAKISIKLREKSNYQFFEVYYLDLNTYEFKHKEDIELYMEKSIMGEGHFHEVYKATQRRSFEKVKCPNGVFQYREKMLNPEVTWVIKKTKELDELDQVPNDIAK